MEKLKATIKEEIDKVMYKLIDSNTAKDSGTLKEWLQSLQRIDTVCKNRNRY